MSTSPAEKPAPGLVTFTARGDHALDRLAADLVDQCDGTTASIADILDQVFSADIETLADALSVLAQPTPSHDLVDHNLPEVGPAAESPDEAARRRLGMPAPGAAGSHSTCAADRGR